MVRAIVRNRVRVRIRFRITITARVRVRARGWCFCIFSCQHQPYCGVYLVNPFRARVRVRNMIRIKVING